jgi:hypothetical protein
MPGNLNEEWRERIDSDVRSLSERVAAVDAGLKSLGIAFDKFTQRFDVSTSEQRLSHQTKWPVILGVLSLVVIIVGGFMRVSLLGYVRDLNRVEASVATIQGNRTSWADPVQDEKLLDLQQEIVAMRLNEHSTLKNDAVMGERVVNLQAKIKAQKENFDELIAREIQVHADIRSNLERRITQMEDIRYSILDEVVIELFSKKEDN